MVRMAFVLLAALPVSDAARGQNDARLAGCLGFTSPLRDRLGTCKMLAAAPAIDAVSRTEADRHASRIMLAFALERLERRNEANELLCRARARDASAQDAARNLVLERAR